MSAARRVVLVAVVAFAVLGMAAVGAAGANQPAARRSVAPPAAVTGFQVGAKQVAFEPEDSRGPATGALSELWLIVLAGSIGVAVALVHGGRLHPRRGGAAPNWFHGAAWVRGPPAAPVFASVV
jgi:hypothetical protein